MGKRVVWIACKKVVEYKQQVTVDDEEYEEIKDLDMDDLIHSDEGYDVIEDHINTSDILDVDDEWLSVQVTTQEEEEARDKRKTAKK